MFEKNLKKSIYFSVIILIGIVAFVVFTIIRNTPESGNIFGFEDISPFEYWFIIAFIGLICLVCISSVFILLRQIVKLNNIAYIIDREGIHDTFVSLSIFAFIIILPVKLIPWSAVKEIKNDEDNFSLEINRKEVIASPVAKLILGIFGYNFCKSEAKELEENEKNVIMNYCGVQTDISIKEKTETESAYTYSTSFKVGMGVLLFLNLFFIILTFLDFTVTAEMSCYLNTILSDIFGFENHPAFAEYFQIANDETRVYFQVDEGILYYIWTAIKTLHVIAMLSCYYFYSQKKPKFHAKKLTLLFVIVTFLISLAGFTTLQFAVHNRIEANENYIIRSEYGKEDVIISDYKDAQMVEVYIPEIEDEDDYSAYENAIIDVTVDDKIYSFYAGDNTTYDGIKKLISYFDESIVVINEVS